MLKPPKNFRQADANGFDNEKGDRLGCRIELHPPSVFFFPKVFRTDPSGCCTGPEIESDEDGFISTQVIQRVRSGKNRCTFLNS